jgi:hypothetical protein
MLSVNKKNKKGVFQRISKPRLLLFVRLTAHLETSVIFRRRPQKKYSKFALFLPKGLSLV